MKPDQNPGSRRGDRRATHPRRKARQQRALDRQVPGYVPEQIWVKGEGWVK